MGSSSASIFSVASPPAILVNNIQSENNSQVNNAEADDERQVEQDSPLFTIGARIRYDDFYNSDLSLLCLKILLWKGSS